jgi:hypothetical protein
MNHNFINEPLEADHNLQDLDTIDGADELLEEYQEFDLDDFKRLGEPDFVTQDPVSPQSTEFEDEDEEDDYSYLGDPRDWLLNETVSNNSGAGEQNPTSPPQEWRLICPPDNWEEPVPIDLAELRLLELLSLRLNLVVSRDDKRKKIYLGLAAGELGVGSTAPNGVNELDQNSPAAGQNAPPRSGLRFPNRWVADVIPNEEAGPEYDVIDVEAAAPLIPAFPDAQISKNFRLSEFRPGEHSYDLIRISPMLVNILEDIRKRAGDQPLHVTSGYRPPAYNRKVGGVSNSAHIDGLAADIYSDYISVDDLYEICDAVIGDRGGVGYYQPQGFIHVDLRGYRARWST